MSISQAHQLAGFESPTKTETVRSVMKGIRRAKGTAQREAAPVVVDTLRLMLDTLPRGLLGTRDRALLLIGFVGALRRSELIALDVADVQFSAAGVQLTVQRSKADQEGRGVVKGIPRGQHAATCPVRALRAWLDLAGISEGPIFRAVNRHGRLDSGCLTGRSIARIVKHGGYRCDRVWESIGREALFVIL